MKWTQTLSASKHDQYKINHALPAESHRGIEWEIVCPRNTAGTGHKTEYSRR